MSFNKRGQKTEVRSQKRTLKMVQGFSRITFHENRIMKHEIRNTAHRSLLSFFPFSSPRGGRGAGDKGQKAEVLSASFLL